MTYVIKLEADFNANITYEIRGTKSLECFTNGRITKMYPIGKRIKMNVGGFEYTAIVKGIVKVYEHSLCEIMY